MTIEDRRGILRHKSYECDDTVRTFIKGAPWGSKEEDKFSHAEVQGSVIFIDLSFHPILFPLTLLRQAAAKSIVIGGPGAFTLASQREVVSLGFFGRRIASEVNLKGAKLSHLQLNSLNLERVNFRKADLRFTGFSGTNLQRADLRGADLRGADLRGADLRGADLRGAGLRGADLQRADLQGAKYNSDTKANIDLFERGAIYDD